MSYFQHHAISNSQVSHFIDRGPQGYYRRYVSNEWAWDDPSDAMKLGTAVHAVVLEGKPLDEVCMEITPDVLSSSGSRAGNAWKQFAAENGDKLLLKRHEYAEFMTIVNAIQGEPYAARLLAMESEREREVYWHDDTHGLERRAKLDMLAATCIVDLKIVNDASERGFARLAAERGYHRQAVYYRDAARSLGHDALPFIFIAAQNCEPFTVACYDLGGTFYEMASEQIDDALSSMKLRFASGDWGRVNRGALTTLMPPNWLKYQGEYDC
jgi:hypothetical protein